MKFYDTSSLLLMDEKLFNEKFVISSITLGELEHIKSSFHKDFNIKQSARKLLNLLDENHDKYYVSIYNETMINPIVEKGLEITNDTKILACALDYEKNYAPDDLIFITNDLLLKQFAWLFFGNDSIQSVKPEVDEYTGYMDIMFHDAAMERFYSNFDKNLYNLKPNQYLIVRDQSKNIVERLCWTGSEYRRLNFNNFNSKWFGEVKPIKGDTYQMLAADSLNNNQITMLKGPAGTGKSYLALGFLLHKLERNKIDKLIIFCNTIATKGSAKLGFYPGTRDEKLLDSQIGNFLSSKLGDKLEVERLIHEGKLILLPLSDIRGYDTSGMRAGVYITEAQNMDVNLMKLALQRIGEDSICIIDGDPDCQVDDDSFADENNGMKRVSKIFRGAEFYGEVELKTIHRSKIAALAEKL